ncbi:MAG: hypothetical protein NUV97_04030 [archaeon]|nr:hypothetical protein [archaeon]
MKKSIYILTLILFLPLTSAATCDPTISLLNQDPYPAVPGEYAKLVFNVENLDVVDCSDITFELLEDYPIRFNPGESPEKVFKRVNYLKDFESSLLIPYKVIIDPDALDGPNSIEIKFQSRGSAAILKTFDVEVEDSKAEFEVYVKDYDYNTNELTIEILNIAASGIEALTVEIPKQETISIKGPNRIVVGDLDSNEYTTAEFEATVGDGWFNVRLIYSDSINVRREVTKAINFDSSYFSGRKADQNGTSTGTYVLWIVIIFAVVYWFLRRRKKKKDKLKKAHL